MPANAKKALRANGHQAAALANRLNNQRHRPILVAGGAGFLGSHLCERLLRDGHAVWCVDNFTTSDQENIAHLHKYPAFKFALRDIAHLDPDEVGQVDAIYNLACPASPVRYQRTPRDTLFTCVHGMDNLLKLAQRDRVKVFCASTSEIYGHPQVHPQKESYWGYVNTMGPRSCYDEGKRCAETLCFIYREQHGVQVRVARIFNTYGPRMHMSDGRVVVNLISQALRNQPLTVYGDGTQTRSFCYVDDLIEAMLAMMRGGEDCCGPINLGNPAEIEILELAKRVIALTGSTSTIVTQPLPVDDPPRRRPDIERARQLLNWQPRTDLDTGLRLTTDDFAQRLSGDVRDGQTQVKPQRAPHGAALAGVDAL